MCGCGLWWCVGLDLYLVLFLFIVVVVFVLLFLVVFVGDLYVGDVVVFELLFEF